MENNIDLTAEVESTRNCRPSTAVMFYICNRCREPMVLFSHYKAQMPCVATGNCDGTMFGEWAKVHISFEPEQPEQRLHPLGEDEDTKPC